MSRRINWAKINTKSRWQESEEKKREEEFKKRITKNQKPIGDDLSLLLREAEKRAKGSQYYAVVLSMARQATFKGELSPKQLALLRAIAEGKQLYARNLGNSCVTTEPK